MGLAMITIGGIGRSEGAVVGTLIIVILDRVLIELGPMRYIIIGVLMMFTILFLRNGLFGIRKQFKEWRNKKKKLLLFIDLKTLKRIKIEVDCLYMKVLY